MIWWFLLGILVLLLILPLGASIFYDAEGVRVLVVAGPIRFTVFPLKKKKPKTKTVSEEPQKPADEVEEPAVSEAEEPKPAQTTLPEAPKPPQAPKEPDGGSITDFLPLVELALKFVGEFFHKTIHIDVLFLKLTMAGDDPADLAISYGNAWAALGNLWPYIDRMFTIKKRDIQIQCDFEGCQTLVNARVDVTVTLARLLGLVINYGVRILVMFLKIQKNRKSSAKQNTNPANNQKAVQ